MPLTLRSWWFVGGFGVAVLGAVVALGVGAGWNALFAVPVLLVLGLGARQSLRVDERGVRYRSLVPSEGFELAWSEVSEVVVDHVSASSPGSPGPTVARVRFVLSSGPPRSASLFSVAGGARVLEVCRARGLPIHDER